MSDAALPHQPRLRSVLIQDLKKLHGFSVQIGRDQSSAPVIDELQGKEGFIFVDQPEKDLVTLPDVEVPDPADVHPLELSLIAQDGFSLEAVRCKQVHIFCDAVPGDKGHDPPELP